MGILVFKFLRLLKKLREVDIHRLSLKINSKRETSTKFFLVFETLRHSSPSQCFPHLQSQCIISSMQKLNTHSLLPFLPPSLPLSFSLCSWSNMFERCRIFSPFFLTRSRRKKPGNNLIAGCLRLNPVQQNFSNQNYYQRAEWFWEIISCNNE